MKNYLTLAIILFTVFIYSQNKVVGHVHYLNSGKKPAVGVEINATGSNGDYSKSDGKYTLMFPHYKTGTTVYPSVGDEIVINGNSVKKIELVNIEKTKIFNIPLDPNKSPLNIIVCPKGYRNMAALKYYNLIKSNTDNLLFKKKKELKELNNKLGDSHKLIDKLKNELALLEKQSDTIVIYKEAFQLASINKDDANQRMIDFLDALDAGVNLETAQKLLNSKKAYKEALQSEKNIYSSIDEIKRDAQNLIRLNKIEEAFQKFDTIGLLLKRELFNPLLLVDNLTELGDLYTSIGYDKKAVDSYEEGLEILKQSKSLEKKDYLLHQLGVIYLENEKYVEAKEYLTKSLNIVRGLERNNPNIFTPIIALKLSVLGKIFTFTEDDDDKKAIESYAESVNIYKTLLASYPGKYNIELGRVLFELSELYYYNAQDDKAEKTYKEALKYMKNGKLDDVASITITEYSKLNFIEYMDEYDPIEDLKRNVVVIDEIKVLANKNPEKYNPILANLYFELGVEYKDQKLYDKAEIELLQSLEIYNILKNKNSNDYSQYVPIVEASLAMTYQNKQQYEKAKIYYLNAIAGFESIDSIIYKSENADALYFLALLYFDLNDIKNAKKYYLKSLVENRFLNEKSNKRNIQLMFNLFRLGEVCYINQEFEQSKKYLIEVLDLLNQSIFDLKIEIIKAYTYQYLAHILNVDEKYDESIQYSKRSLNLLELNKDLKKKNLINEDGYNLTLFLLSRELVYSYYKLKNYSKSEELYLKAIELSKKTKMSSPYLGDLYISIGNAYLLNNEFNKAEDVFLKYNLLDIDKKQSLVNRSKYYAVKNEKKIALEYLSNAIDLGFNDFDWIKSTEFYDNIRNTTGFKALLKKERKPSLSKD